MTRRLFCIMFGSVVHLKPRHLPSGALPQRKSSGTGAMQKNTETVKEEIIHLLARASPQNRKAVIDLFPAAKASLDSGYVPHDAVRHRSLHG